MLTRLEWKPPAYTGKAEDDWDRLVKSIKGYLDGLNRKGALELTEASFNGTTVVCDSINVNGGGVISRLVAGTYTPTGTGVANLDTITMYQAQYLAIGNTVLVSGRFDANAAVTATLTQFRMTLPIASNLGATEDLGGAAFAPAVAGLGAAIKGDATNNAAFVEWVVTDTNDREYTFIFSYQVI